MEFCTHPHPTLPAHASAAHVHLQAPVDVNLNVPFNTQDATTPLCVQVPFRFSAEKGVFSGYAPAGFDGQYVYIRILDSNYQEDDQTGVIGMCMCMLSLCSVCLFVFGIILVYLLIIWSWHRCSRNIRTSAHSGANACLLRTHMARVYDTDDTRRCLGTRDFSSHVHVSSRVYVNICVHVLCVLLWRFFSCC